MIIPDVSAKFVRVHNWLLFVKNLQTFNNISTHLLSY